MGSMWASWPTCRRRRWANRRRREPNSGVRSSRRSRTSPWPPTRRRTWACRSGRRRWKSGCTASRSGWSAPPARSTPMWRSRHRRQKPWSGSSVTTARSWRRRSAWTMMPPSAWPSMGPACSSTATTRPSASTRPSPSSRGAGAAGLPADPPPASGARGHRTRPYYVVREVLFTLPLPGWGELNWRAFVEPATGAVLYLRAFVACATACVFVPDPITASGNARTAARRPPTLDPLRTTVTLPGLDPPDAGEQALAGDFVALADTDPPTSRRRRRPRRSPSATRRHRRFHRGQRLPPLRLRLPPLEGMGFDLASYFDGTSFPVPVDHQGVATR